MYIVLLDADVIIDLHKFGIWNIITKRNEVLIPSTILRREVYYYEDDSGFKHDIYLLKKAGKTFKEISLKAEEILNFKKTSLNVS